MHIYVVQHKNTVEKTAILSLTIDTANTTTIAP